MVKLLKSLTDTQIDAYCKQIRDYGGCHMQTQLPKLEPYKLYFINLDNRPNGSGSHWCLLYNADPKYAIYFDPFGIVPPPSIKKWIKKKTLYYNDIQLQDYKAESCGYYCLYVGFRLIDGITLPDITINDFTQDTKQNEKILRKDFKSVRNYTYIYHGGSIIDKIKDIYNFVKGNRNRFAETGRKLLDKYGEQYIKHIWIKRRPLNNAITTLGNWLTRGDMNRVKDGLKYDKLYHLYMVIMFDNNDKIQIEKLNVPVISSKIEQDNKDVEQINFEPRKRVKFNEFVNNGIKLMGPEKFFSYNVRTNNCQIFLKSLLDASNINENVYNSFIIQDAPTLLRKLPSGVSKGLDALLNLATRADVIIHGSSIKKRKKYKKKIK